MKIRLLTIILLALGFEVSGQGLSITGAVLDEEAGITLPGAHIVLIRLPDSLKTETITDEAGRFRIEQLRAGNYNLTATYVGYEPFTKSVELRNQPLDVGAIRMKQESTLLQQVEVREKAIMATQEGDTTSFNAVAFRTNPDANAEDLVRKMPGITIENGQVQAQGESVREILVDGKPFFGNDPSAALRNLPAEVIERIQVFDQQSEQSQFTGINDGQTSKTINIVTKSNSRSGQFGKIYAGYGSDERYLSGGNINIFKGDSRISLIGMSNNINQQNFASDDLLGVVGGQRRGGPGGGFMGAGGGGFGGFGRGGTSDFLVSQRNGIAQTHAFGLNYSDSWGKKVQISASYFFNNSDNDAFQDLNRDFISQSDFDQVYTENSETNNLNTNHRFNARMEYTIDEKNSIIFRPRFSFQKNDGTESAFGQTLAEASLLNQTDYRFNSDLWAINYESELLFRHRFAKRGRTFSINVETGFNPQEGDNALLSRNDFYNGGVLSDTLDQIATLDVRGWSVEADATYTEPVGEKGMLDLRFSTSYEWNDSDKRTFDYESITQDHTSLNPILSNTFDNTYLTQRAGTGYMVRGEKMTLNTRLNVQWAQLAGDQEFPYIASIERNFVNVLPSAFLRWDFSKQTNLRANYRTSTSPPSITQLQDVIDNRNPLRLSAGNPNLDQSYQHSMFVRVSRTNPQKSTVFYALVSGSYTDNYVANSTFIARKDTLIREGVLLARGAQFLQPVNLDGYWNVRSFLTYGLPFKMIKSNLNIRLSATYNRQPGLINEELNIAHNTSVGLGLTMSSNISEKLDFTLSSTSNGNRVRNSLNTNLNDEYLNQNTQFTFNWIFGKGFVFRSDLMHQLYAGLSEGFDQNFWLWNLSFGKKFLKRDQGELRLAVFDVLKQNTSIQRNVTEAYLEDVRSNVLQQYAVLTFTYNLRNFGQPQQQNEPRRDEWRRWD